jgi:hypothetical protein
MISENEDWKLVTRGGTDMASRCGRSENHAMGSL